jgi:phosphoserine phosphatase RsbU/P
MNANVAVYTEDNSILESLKKAAEETPFIFTLNPEPTEEGSANRMVVCDVLSLTKRKKLISKIDKNSLFVISELSDEENMELIQLHELHHLIGKNENVYAQETVSHIKKVLGGKIWGINAYLGNNSEVKILSLSDSKHTNQMIEEALAHFDFKDYFSSPIEYIQVMANELISNSLYKGPNRRRSEQGLNTVDRKSPVFLKGSDLVQVTLGMDDKGVALSVQDSFGGLNYVTLISSLKRSFREKTALDKIDGAGLGLYLTFLHSNQFIINYRENFRTEVICIIEKNKRYKNYKQRIRSFHYFQEVKGEKINN